MKSGTQLGCDFATWPAMSWNPAPARAPAMPPNPVTLPTAALGNRSEASVNRLADQPWCPAAARPTSATTTQRLLENGAYRIGRTIKAQIRRAVLREDLRLLPPPSMAA